METKNTNENGGERAGKTKALASDVPNTIRQGSKKVGSFFARVTPDAWILAFAILLGSLFVVAALMPPLASDTKKGAEATAEDMPAPAPQEVGETTIDKDPVLGDPKAAKVAIVEFSDFECPFCKKFHEESYQKLVDKYVTTGKAVWVFRDLPLPFHDPVATTSAGIANCVFNEKGASAYFALMPEMYKNTLTNGKGIPAATLDKLIVAQGVGAAAMKTCAETQAVKSEITADIDAATAIGIEGTPSFVIGTLDAEGNVKGEVVVGAQPFATFEKIVDKYIQ
jgi:protein-disulfide isomerase